MNEEEIIRIINRMPIFGEMRQYNKLLTFGQYLTVLKRWYEQLKSATIEQKDGNV